MKVLSVLLLMLALAGCGEEVRERYEWVLERERASPEKFQSACNYFAAHDWQFQDDNDIESAGKYVIFVKVIRPSVAQYELEEVRKFLESRR